MSFNGEIKALTLQCLQEKKKKVESFYSVASMFEVPVVKTDYAINHAGDGTHTARVRDHTNADNRR